jgi:hypothetical protein
MDEAKDERATLDRSGRESYKPKSEEEELKIREQIRSELADLHKLAIDKYVSLASEERTRALSYSKEYGQIVVKTVFLLNGGAIIALLTFISSMYGKSDLNILVAISLGKKLVPAFYLFAIGLVSAALVAAIGFFNWGWAALSHPDPAEVYNFVHHTPIEDRPEIHVKVGRSYQAAVGFAVVSLSCFIIGAFLVTSAFTVLGIG